MKIIENKIIRVPQDLGAVTTCATDSEVDPKSVGMTQKNVDNIWKVIESLYRTGIYPGISFCLRRQGKILINRAIGHARGNGPNDRQETEKVLMTPQTPVCIFSASKAVTAMLMHLLDERHLISLMDPVSYYIPEFGLHGKRNTTIYQLLCHRGGIPNDALKVKANLNTLLNHELMLSLLYEAKSLSPQGRFMVYHALTSGYIFGKLVEIVTGQNIRKFLEEAMLKPLGFQHFNYGVPASVTDQVAVNYSTGPHGLALSPVFFFSKRALGADWDTIVDASNDPRFLQGIIPAGNIIGTAEETSRFFQLLMNKGQLHGVRVFEPMTVQHAILETSGPQFDRNMMLPMRYSAGMMLGNVPYGMFGPDTGQAFGHLGFMTQLVWADPQREIAVAFLNTGKALLGSYLVKLQWFLATIASNCPRRQWRQDPRGSH